MPAPRATDAADRECLELIVHCARTSMDARRAHRLTELMHHGLDWPQVLALAQLHGVLPLVQIHLAQNAAVPKTFRDQLGCAARLNAEHSLLLTSRLLSVLTILKRSGIEGMPFKGPILAARLYGDVSFRQFGDLDLFIRPAAVMDARRVLLEAGYQGPMPFTASQEETFFRSEHHIELHNGDNVYVELHWTATPRNLAVHIDMDQMWRRAKPVSFAGKRIANPSPEDLLVLLCVHGFKHEWRRVGWVCDVAQLVASTPHLQWRVMWRRAADAGAERMVRLGLLLARDLLGAELPATVDECVRDDHVARGLSARIRGRYEVDAGASPSEFSRARFQIAAHDRWRNKFRYVWRLALTPCSLDRDVVSLPSRLACLYSFVRPVRLLAKHAANCFASYRRPRPFQATR